MTNRKQFGILIALVLGAGFVGGVVGSLVLEKGFGGEVYQANKIIKAKNFVVVDDQGNELGLFGITDEGETTLLLSDVSGNLSGGISVFPNNNVKIGLYHKGTIRSNISLSQEGHSVFSISNARGDSTTILAGPQGVQMGISERKNGDWETVWSAP